MQGVMLEPYAATLNWTAGRPLAAEAWREMLLKFFSDLANVCREPAPAVIGHIKGLAVFSDESFFRVSVVAPDMPPDIQGSAPDHASRMTLTINLLVYGQPGSNLRQYVREVAALPWPVMGNRGRDCRGRVPSSRSPWWT